MSFEIRFPAIATERELADKPFSSKEHYFKKRWTRATCRLNTPLVSLRRASGIRTSSSLGLETEAQVPVISTNAHERFIMASHFSNLLDCSPTLLGAVTKLGLFRLPRLDRRCASLRGY